MSGPIIRASLADVSTLEHAVELLRRSRKIIVVAGAGVSVSAGVPDFRTPETGFYDVLRRSGLPALESVGEPQEIFDINVFKSEPEIFYSVAHLLYTALGKRTQPGTHPYTLSIRPSYLAGLTLPTLTHSFFRALEVDGRLLRLYTQVRARSVGAAQPRAFIAPPPSTSLIEHRRA